MKAYRGVDVYIHIFLTFTTEQDYLFQDHNPRITTTPLDDNNIYGKTISHLSNSGLYNQ
jgi:hypothetical protein